jgi:type IV secretory pathway TrbD component
MYYEGAMSEERSRRARNDKRKEREEPAAAKEPSEPEPASAVDDPETEDVPAEESAAATDDGDALDEPAGAPPPVAKSFGDWITGARIPREMALLFGLIMPAMLLAVNMWKVHPFTVDDSYISFRYARNLARGLGLVYNEGERIEGYTNFLWTVLLAGGIKLGIDPDRFAKILGAASAFGSLGLTYAISDRLSPYRTLPCVATWLLASTILFSGYAVFGLETGAFVCLILAGTYLFLREAEPFARPGQPTPPPGAFPWSGLVFALAVLTRPEAPMYIGILALFLGRRILDRQNILRGALFTAPWVAHLLWRHSYYGSWVPNTLSAKTGNIDGQLLVGLDYVRNYVFHAGPVVYLAFGGLAIGLVARRRDLLAISAIGVAVMLYVVLVGGDWMKYFRFLAPFEPFCFLLVDVAVRRVIDRRHLATNLAMSLFAITVIGHRAGMLREAQTDLLTKEKRFWDMAAGGTANWLVQNTTRGEMAIGDIGYVGWLTDYPILDLLGLVDPVISKLPGGYTQKLGPGFNERFFDKKPDYMLLISSNVDCMHPSVPGSQVIFRDRRFLPMYQMAGKVPLDGGFAWCIFKKK